MQAVPYQPGDRIIPCSGYSCKHLMPEAAKTQSVEKVFLLGRSHPTNMRNRLRVRAALEMNPSLIKPLS